MTKELMEIQERLIDVETDDLADVMIEMLFGTGDDGFEPYEAAKSICSLAGRVETEHEYYLISDTITAIFGWSLETMLNRIESNKEE